MFEVASLISEDSVDVSLSIIQKMLSAPELGGIAVNLRPEVAAEAMGLIRSEMADFGIYVLIDIGASTLDVCVFKYFFREREKQALFVANVELLGSQSPIWLKEIMKTEPCLNLNHLCKEIYTTIASPIVHTKKHRCPHEDAWRGKDSLTILVAGGGRQSEIHKQCIHRVEKNLCENTKITNFEFKEPVVPKTLELNCPHDSYHRLAVAWGLSIDNANFAEIDLPGVIEDIEIEKSPESDFVSKDQV